MARRPTRAEVRRQFETLADQYEKQLLDAFIEAVTDIANRAEIGRMVERLERGDIQGALDAVHLDPAAFRTLEEAFRAAYGAGGVAAVSGMPALRDPNGGRLVVRFDMRAPRVERYLREHSSSLVTRIIDEQRESIRLVLQRGMMEGANPKRTALNIVGRVQRGSNRRTGGILGLSGPQARAVENARSGLLSGDPDAMRAYLGLTRRDKRFDRTVAKAIREGKGLDRDTVARITGRYSDRLLALRGETIARTETLGALARSKDEAFRQLVDTGAVQAQQVKKRWVATKDNRTRDSHAAIDGDMVALDQPFSNGLLYPHAPGAPAEEVVNCRCTYEHVVDYLAGIE
ncbi:phage minor head protein [Henriciella sp.]|uniref:phage minor head protein n=1 Tax=Henriciella sp. TaxID=1968823 RepID=UPI000C0E4E3B|nr:phage minor head protein [Henriciella sp.]PHR83103.1 MAG: head morphogenesis protein [Henriciella sp.]